MAENENHPDPSRALGVDIGLKRLGLAISDASGMLARPWRTIETPGDARAVADRLAMEVRDLAGEDDGLGTIVIGLPRRLDGSPTHLTDFVHAVVNALRALTVLPVVLQDERLTSREADSRLARRERDWRRRKALLDAASAAVILQDYLDSRTSRS